MGDDGRERAAHALRPLSGVTAMGIDYSTLIYLPNFDMFARPIVITPAASQPGAAAYTNRGIYHSDTTQYLAENNTIISDQTTTLDIREEEFDVLPVRGDFVNIPKDGNVRARGDFEIVNVWHNGGGEITLQIRKLVGAIPLRR
jgi:hypothetical protein